MIRPARRLILAGLALFGAGLALASCGPSGEGAFSGPSARIDPADPFASLRPWNPDWRQVKDAENGVQYIIIAKGPGQGGFPSPADQVEVTFDARFAESGEKFDGTPEGETVVRRVNDWIPGWSDGLPKLQAGDTAMLWIPWRRAFGMRGRGGMPPRADVMVLVTLHRIIPAPAIDTESWAKATPWPQNSPDIIRTSSGLEYFITRPATAESRAAAGAGADDRPLRDTDTVVVNYEGRLEDAEENDDHMATVFGSSFAEGQPAYWPVKELIPGMTEALNLMHAGDRIMARMPPNIAYGDESNERILPNSTLVFEIELVNVIHGEAAPEPAPSPSRRRPR